MPIAPPPQPSVGLGALRPDAGGCLSAPAPRSDGPARPTEADATIAPRRCGRCLAMFPGDPTLDPFALPEWWLCPPCRLALLGQETPGTPTGAPGAR